MSENTKCIFTLKEHEITHRKFVMLLETNMLKTHIILTMSIEKSNVLSFLNRRTPSKITELLQEMKIQTCKGSPWIISCPPDNKVLWSWTIWAVFGTTHLLFYIRYLITTFLRKGKLMLKIKNSKIKGPQRTYDSNKNKNKPHKAVKLSDRIYNQSMSYHVIISTVKLLRFKKV